MSADIRIVNQNTMLVDDRFLRLTEIKPDELEYILKIARTAIDDAIEHMYVMQLARNPDAFVQRGSVWVARVAANPRVALSAEGIDLYDRAGARRQVFDDPAYFKPRYQPYIHSAQRANLIPEAAIAGAGKLLLAVRTEPHQRAPE